MPVSARYVHTNLVARDWRRLARFYGEVFGCVPHPPERDLSGDWLDALTGIERAHLTGIHLLLPGQPAGGVTLEIFSYDRMPDRAPPAVNEPGFGHVAFLVDDVDAALAAVLAGGGGAVGRVSSADIPGAGPIQVVYARDPEGNVIELQHWHRADDRHDRPPCP